MAKKRSPRQVKAKPRPLWIRFLGFLLRILRRLFTPPGLYFTLLAAVAGVVYWQWANITAWVRSVVDNTVSLFGWGLTILFLSLLTIVVLAVRRRLSALWYGWRYWLSIVAFLAAIWGTLAFWNLGGDVGKGIIGGRDFLGGLRVAGIMVVGIVLLIPGASWRLTSKAATGAVSQVTKHRAQQSTFATRSAATAEQPNAGSKASMRAQLPTARIDRDVPIVQTKPEESTTADDTPPREGLRQVAQEVWRKYGEAESTMTVDGWKLPPVDILEKSPEVVFSQSDNSRRARLIEEALESYGVEAKVVQINTGPTVTQFGIEPGWDRKIREFKEKDREQEHKKIQGQLWIPCEYRMAKHYCCQEYPLPFWRSESSSEKQKHKRIPCNHGNHLLVDCVDDHESR